MTSWETVVDFIPAVTISANRFIPIDRRKSVFFRIARFYPAIVEPLRNLPISSIINIFSTSSFHIPLFLWFAFGPVLFSSYRAEQIRASCNRII